MFKFTKLRLVHLSQQSHRLLVVFECVCKATTERYNVLTDNILMLDKLVTQ